MHVEHGNNFGWMSNTFFGISAWLQLFVQPPPFITSAITVDNINKTSTSQQPLSLII